MTYISVPKTVTRVETLSRNTMIFLLASPQRRHQVVGLLEVGTELEHPENPQHPDDPNDQQVLGIAVVQSQDPRHDRQQIHQAIETEGIAQRLGRAVQAQAVLDDEDEGEAPLDTGQQGRVIFLCTLSMLSSITITRLARMINSKVLSKRRPATVSAWKNDHVEAFTPIVAAFA
nr:hypothetical protein GCM10020185_56710 [Pseudomonas brassicacearum subsp. brassicacearum]